VPRYNSGRVDNLDRLRKIKQATTIHRGRFEYPQGATRLEAAGAPEQSEFTISNVYDRSIVRMFYIWTLLLCFFYGALPYLRWNIGVGINITPDKVVLVPLLTLFVISQSSRENVSQPSTRSAATLGFLLALFTIVSLISWWINGADVGNRSFGELTRVVNLSLYPALAYFLARRLKYSRPMLLELLAVLALFGTYLSVTAFAEHFSVKALIFPAYISDPHIGVQVGRSRGPFVNTIGNGGMLLLSFAAMSCIATSLVGLKRLLAAVSTMLTIPAIYFTETRSVWLGLASLTATFLILRTSLRKVSATIISVLFVAFLLGIGSKFSMFDQTLFSRRQNTVDYRLDNYEFAWRAFKAHPLFGLGYGKFQSEWSNYADLRNSRLGIGLDDGNHSTLLGILADLGLVGAIPFIGMLASGGFVCVSAYRKLSGQPDSFERKVSVAAIGALEIFIVLGITSDLRTSPTVNITTFWFVGMIASVASSSNNVPTNRGLGLNTLARPSPRDRGGVASMSRALARPSLH
jgi:O-antigen ligase